MRDMDDLKDYLEDFAEENADQYHEPTLDTEEQMAVSYANDMTSKGMKWEEIKEKIERRKPHVVPVVKGFMAQTSNREGQRTTISPTVGRGQTGDRFVFYLGLFLLLLSVIFFCSSVLNLNPTLRNIMGNGYNRSTSKTEPMIDNSTKKTRSDNKK